MINATQLKQLLLQYTDSVVRPLCIELAAKTAVIEALKQAHPRDASAIDRTLENALQAKAAALSAEHRIADLLKGFVAIDAPNFDQVVAELLRQTAQTKAVN